MQEAQMKLPKSVKQKLELSKGQMILRVSVQQIMIIAGAIISAMGYVVFQLPHNIAAGGVTGLGILLNDLTGFPVGLFYLLFNIPLFILGFFWLGRWQFVWSSLVAVLVFSFSSDILVHYIPIWMGNHLVTSNNLLAAIYAGVLYGLGTGLIYRYGGTIGGTSITARIIFNKTGYPLSQSYLFTDLAIILAAGLIFNLETALLAVITVIVVGIFSDFVLEGTSQMRTIMIITEHPDAIRLAIINELQRGISHWEVTGGYSQTNRTMLYLTALRSRIYDVKYIVSSIDPNAFMVVGVSQQVWGGYNAPKIDHR